MADSPESPRAPTWAPTAVGGAWRGGCWDRFGQGVSAEHASAVSLPKLINHFAARAARNEKRLQRAATSCWRGDGDADGGGCVLGHINNRVTWPCSLRFSFWLLLLISCRKWRNCHKTIEIIYHAIFRLGAAILFRLLRLLLLLLLLLLLQLCFCCYS